MRIHWLIGAIALLISSCAVYKELQPKANVVGDVSYGVLEMHPGAAVTGELRRMTAPERPPLQLAASNDA